MAASGRPSLLPMIPYFPFFGNTSISSIFFMVEISMSSMDMCDMGLRQEWFMGDF
jgi:hypothetical protein